MLTQKQIEERRNYIGGSDIAAVLGLSRWKTPLKVWGEKTGNIEPDDLSDVESVEMGNELEDTVARIFTKRTGKKLHRVNETLYHPKNNFLAANVDRRVVGEDAICEIKTCSAWRAKEFKDEELPIEFILQVMHYLSVSGKQKGYLACLIGGQKFIWKEIIRDDNMIGEMTKKVISFWNDFVIPKKMPIMIKSSDTETLYKMFPVGDEGQEIELKDDANKLIESRNAMYQDCILLEKQIEQTENELKAMLKDCAIGKTNKYVVTWKNQSRIGLDTKQIKKDNPKLYTQYSKETKLRKFEIKEIKGE